ncbi:MAG: hypothetical protein AB7O62_05940 [Pirellulales bacterium]
MDRRQKIIMMRDILDHLHDCFEQWEAPQQRSVPWLAESIERDLVQFRRLCDALKQETLDSPERPAALMPCHG